jgi:predicted TPR repeat methyltransferase
MPYNGIVLKRGTNKRKKELNMKTAIEIAANIKTATNRRANLVNRLNAVTEEQVKANTLQAAENLVNQLDVRAELGCEIIATAAFTGKIDNGYSFPLFLHYGEPTHKTIVGNVDFNHPINMKQLLELLTNAGYNYEITHRNETDKEGNPLTLVNTLKVSLPTMGRN